MSVARHHNDWLRLIESSGPFVSMPVLMRVFRQGLDQVEPAKKNEARLAYEEWLEKPSEPAHHRAWVKFVLSQFLEFPASTLVEGQSIPAGLEAPMPEYSETLRPDLVVVAPPGHAAAGAAQLLVQFYPSGQKLDSPVSGKHWKATPATRMMDLLHASNVPLGLVTTGEEWMLVFAPLRETTGYTTWYAGLWFEEPITLRAFASLLCVRRFFGVAEGDTLLALLKESAQDQQEVTEQLGLQVRHAVEVLVQAFDRLDQDSGRQLLEGIDLKMLYEAALTVMMRLVFLFSAEERKLLRLGEPLYDDNYAVSTLREQLREAADQHTEEVLSHRFDAWARLLATFRAVHGGVTHESLRLPAYGGTLFDPDRFPFLEGRVAGSKWSETPAEPLTINNRVVLHLLESLQMLRVKLPGGGPTEARRLSFRSLGIEQIGHVYEGLLDHTAVRAGSTVLGLQGTRSNEPEIPLEKVEQLLAAGEDKLIEFLKEETKRSESALRRTLREPQLDANGHKLLIACGQDSRLRDRVVQFAGLIREDDFQMPVIIQSGSVYVTEGTTRRSTGTHYTPPSLTEPIVQHTLEPLIYEGPAEGRPKEEWKLKLPKEILSLKVCDMAMGSGAFLVQACRFLAERLVEAWENLETANPGKFLVAPDGELSTGDPAERLVPKEPLERLAIAMRAVADRCLYGVDINPMAVEMAKLSLWLVTLQRDRPFTFLNHALKCGDSLLGVNSVKQIENFSLHSGEQQITFGTANLFRHVEEASAKRRALEELPSNDHTQIELKNRLHAEAEAATAKVKALADCLIAFELRGLNGDAYTEQRTADAEKVQLLMERDADAEIETSNPRSELARAAREALRGRRTFHWPVECPEVFAVGGFSALVGNPPFQTGYKIGRTLGSDFFEHLGREIARGAKGSADLCAFFVLRAHDLLTTGGVLGLLTTKTIAQGDSRAVGLDQLLDGGSSIIRAVPTEAWPGDATVEIAKLWLYKGAWAGRCNLDNKDVEGISASLTEMSGITAAPYRLVSNSGVAFKGTTLGAIGFALEQEEALELLRHNSRNREVVFPYINGQDTNSRPDSSARRWVINFHDWPLEKAREFPECLAIVDERVKDYREALTGQIHEPDYWKFMDKRLESYAAIRSMEKVLAIALTSKTLSPVFIGTRQVIDQNVVVFKSDRIELFACIACSLHYWWVLRYGTPMRTDARYLTKPCFETFPFPQGVLNKTNSDLANLPTYALARICEIGMAYLRARNELMAKRAEGLTTTYNRFHDRGEQSEDIVRLRALHVEMDQAVAAAYGWSDLDLGHGFHETKQGVRYTISEPARRTVLDRLLALNHQRYEEEVKAGLHGKSNRSRRAKKPKETTAASREGTLIRTPQGDLF